MKKKTIALGRKLIFTKDTITDLNPDQQEAVTGGITGQSCVITNCTVTNSISPTCAIQCLTRTRNIQCISVQITPGC